MARNFEGLRQADTWAAFGFRIQVQDVLRVLQPIWTDKTETATRVRSRIEDVLSWATVSGHRAGDNPARWIDNLKELLPTASKVAKSEIHPTVAIEPDPIDLIQADRLV